MPKGKRTNYGHPSNNQNPAGQPRPERTKIRMALSKGSTGLLGRPGDPYYIAPKFRPLQLDIPYPETDWKYTFLLEMARFPNVTQAAIKAGIHPFTPYQAKKRLKKFSDLWDLCVQARIDEVEQVVFERSLNPMDPGSANLSKFVLQSHRPETYDRGKNIKHEHEIHGKEDSPVKIQVSTVDYRSYLGAIAPVDRPLLEGNKVKDIGDEEEELFGEFSEILDSDG
jgi:hypothetical protein